MSEEIAVKTLALIAVTACTHPLQVPLGAASERQSQYPRPDDIAVCAPIPSLPEQNKALVDYVARLLAFRLYRLHSTCDALSAELPADLYGRPMTLICPRGRLCSAGDDVRAGTPDDVCQNVIMQGNSFRPSVLPRVTNRFIPIELPLCPGGEEPLGTAFEFVRQRGVRSTVIVSLNCPAVERCQFMTVRLDDVGGGTLTLAAGKWRVTAYQPAGE